MNLSKKAVPFAIYYANDAYSTSKKIMGRQSAGKAFVKGIARTWPEAVLYGLGPDSNGGQELALQISRDGYHGEIRWNQLPNLETARSAGTLYFPAPLTKDLAHFRNMHKPGSFSLMGVTHTLSSSGALDLISDLILPPFKPWDAMICTSQCGQDLVRSLHANMVDWWRDQAGVSRFNSPQLPLIPLGVDAPHFINKKNGKINAKNKIGINPDEVAFLFSGRLTFHAKANPIPMYQALEKAAQISPIVCVEAGIYPNQAIRQEYLNAQQVVAPSVRFIWVDGQNEILYRQAWEAGDVFVSLSDNIQETFGLTPIEAKAAGMPVIVSDWNGYKETVREGIDGFRIPTTLPPAGAGQDLAIRHAFNIDSYDYFIGRTSLATVVEPNALADAVSRLASDPRLREAMGNAGMEHAQKEYDWPVVLKQYAELAEQLEQLRKIGAAEAGINWPQREDPFSSFGHFSTSTLKGDWLVRAQKDAAFRLNTLLTLKMTSYAFEPHILAGDMMLQLLDASQKSDAHTVNSLLATTDQANPSGARALMWLWKFDLIHIIPKTSQ